MSWNIQSKNCSIRGNKFDITEFINTTDECRIVCLQEITNTIQHTNQI